MIEELARHRCTGDDGTPLFVIEHCHVFITQGDAGTRQYRGAAWLTLLDGKPVRYIDARTFEVVATGEFIAHDSARCACAPAIKVSKRKGIGESRIASA